MPWRSAPPAARALAGAVSALVGAAWAADAAAVHDATAALSSHDGAAVNTLLERVVRSLLEETHLDGLSGDDIALVLDGCFERATGWFPDADPGVFVIVLTGALGIIDPEEDEPSPPSEADLSRHAALVVADLLAVGQRTAEDLDHYLDAALAETVREQSVELP